MCTINKSWAQLKWDQTVQQAYLAYSSAIVLLLSSSVDNHISLFAPSSFSGDDSETSSRYCRSPLHFSATRAQSASQSWRRLRPCWHDGCKLIHWVGGDAISQSGWANPRGKKYTMDSWELRQKFIYSMWNRVLQSINSMEFWGYGKCHSKFIWIK